MGAAGHRLNELETWYKLGRSKQEVNSRSWFSLKELILMLKIQLGRDEPKFQGQSSFAKSHVHTWKLVNEALEKYLYRYFPDSGKDTKWCLSMSSTCTISTVVSMQMTFHLCLQPSFSSWSQDLYSHLYLDILQTSSSTRYYFLSQAYFYPTFFELIVPSSKSFTCEASALWFLWLPCWPHSGARSSWSYFHLNPEIYTVFSPLA